MNRKTRNALLILTVGVTTASAGFAAFVLANSSSLLLVTPGGPHEGLCPVSNHLNSPTNLTLNLANCGNYSANLISYYVKWNSYQYANPNWSGPTVPLNAQVPVNIIIDGNSFSFQSGNTYTIIINTTRANYTFTVTA